MINLAWHVRRLRKMSPAEIVMRSRDAVVKHAWRTRFCRPRLPSQPQVQPNAELLSLPDPEALQPRPQPEARQAVVAEAQRILAGEVTVLNHRSALLGEHPDWFTDLRTGRRAPARPYCFDIDHRNPLVTGEIKYVWEPSRHQHLTVLAAAYYLTGSDAFAERIAAHLQSWWRDNPFLHGIHWVSGIEVGLRLIAWVWIRRFLSRWSGVEGLFDGNPDFWRQLYEHQIYLSALSSHGSSANNHLVAEAVGMFVSATAFPVFVESRRWQASAAVLVGREVQAQTFPDGLNRELATSYHGFVMELFLLVAAEDHLAGDVLGPQVWQRLTAMADALASMLDVAGHPPRQGDDDGAFALVVDGHGFDRWRSLLATLGQIVGPCSWWPAVQAEADLRSCLIATVAGEHLQAVRPARPIRQFPGAGMTLLRDLDATGDEIWLRFDHGPLGFGPTAAHGHADALSIEVRHGGIEVFSDPGTYCYHAQDAWRSYFRSTVAHNTLELGNLDQSRSGGLFLWMNDVTTKLEWVHGLDKGAVAECNAFHDGYRRLRPPAVHRRRVRLDRVRRTIDIIDQVLSEGRHPVRLAFHLGPHIDCRLERVTARLSWLANGQPRAAELTLPTQLEWSLHRGLTAPTLGWHSPAFGVIEPTFTLLGAGTHSAVEFCSRLEFADRGAEDECAWSVALRRSQTEGT